MAEMNYKQKINFSYFYENTDLFTCQVLEINFFFFMKQFDK